MIRLLVVDDQPLIRHGLTLILDAQPDMTVLGEADDGQAAVRQVAALRPDVVLMDVRMPGLDGIEATRRILAPGGSARVLLLTTFDLDEYAFEGLRAGASGFLLKGARPEELLAGIRAVAGGDAVVAPSTTRRLLDAYADRLGDPAADEADPATRLGPLTPREREVFAVLAEGRTNAEIAQALFLSETTVKTHVARILTKLTLRDRVQAVVFAYETGLIRPGHGPG